MIYTKDREEDGSYTKGPSVIVATNKLECEDEQIPNDRDNAMDRKYLICPFEVNSF